MRDVAFLPFIALIVDYNTLILLIFPRLLIALAAGPCRALVRSLQVLPGILTRAWDFETRQ